MANINIHESLPLPYKSDVKSTVKFLKPYIISMSHAHLDVGVSSHKALFAIIAVDAQCNFHFLV
jgi:hypothetical protein